MAEELEADDGSCRSLSLRHNIRAERRALNKVFAMEAEGCVRGASIDINL